MIDLRPRAWLVTSIKGDDSVHGHRAPADLYAVRVHGVVEPLVRLCDALAAIESVKATLVPLIVERRK